MRKELLLAAGLVLVYVCFLTQSHYWDGVLFSLYVEKVFQGSLATGYLLHPNHLVYTASGYLGYAILQSLQIPIRAITVFQVINVSASVASAYILFSLSKRLFHSSLLVFSSTLLFASGATWWRFSTDADGYILSVLLLLSAVAILLSQEQPSIFWAAADFMAAMLFHELAVLGYVPIILAIWFKTRDRERRIWSVAVFVGGTSVVTAGIYYAAYRFTHTDSAAQSFFSWITSVSNDTRTTGSLQQFIIANVSSYGKLFAGGKLSLIRDFLSVPIVAALLLAMGCLVGAVVTARRRSQTDNGSLDRGTKIVLWAWVAIYALFLSWFEPGNAFYKLFIWPPIVLLIGAWCNTNSPARVRVFGWLTLALASWNFGAFIYPHSQVRADPVLSLAKQIDRELPASATVYYKALSPDDWYLEYFAPGRDWRPLPPNGELKKGKAVAPVCLETTALQVMKVETDPALRWNLVNTQHNVRLECLKAKPD